MPKAHDCFVTTLKKAHLEWGTHRHTSTRDQIYGEGYLQIPLDQATKLNIYNSNKAGANIEYNCTSSDEFLVNVKLKASGSIAAGEVYAKQFQGSGNLKVLGDWFSHIGAKAGDKIEILWTSPTDISITKI